MVKYTFEIIEKDEKRGVHFFDVKVIEADSFGELQREFDRRYGRSEVSDSALSLFLFLFYLN